MFQVPNTGVTHESLAMFYTRLPSLVMTSVDPWIGQVNPADFIFKVNQLLMDLYLDSLKILTIWKIGFLKLFLNLITENCNITLTEVKI